MDAWDQIELGSQGLTHTEEVAKDSRDFLFTRWVSIARKLKTQFYRFDSGDDPEESKWAHGNYLNGSELKSLLLWAAEEATPNRTSDSLALEARPDRTSRNIEAENLILPMGQSAGHALNRTLPGRGKRNCSVVTFNHWKSYKSWKSYKVSCNAEGKNECQLFHAGLHTHKAQFFTGHVSKYHLATYDRIIKLVSGEPLNESCTKAKVIKYWSKHWDDMQKWTNNKSGGEQTEEDQKPWCYRVMPLLASLHARKGMTAHDASAVMGSPLSDWTPDQILMFIQEVSSVAALQPSRHRWFCHTCNSSECVAISYAPRTRSTKTNKRLSRRLIRCHGLRNYRKQASYCLSDRRTSSRVKGRING